MASSCNCGAPATSDSFILTENGFYRQEGEAVPELGAGVVTGNLNGTAITAGKLNGDQISLTVGGTTYTGRVNAAGNAIAGGNLNATKLN